jgi:hypothetical protein
MLLQGRQFDLRAFDKKGELRMEDNREVLLYASPEVEELLADNGINLVEVLRREGLEVGRGSVTEGIPSAQSGLKEPVTILLASAAVIASLTPIISKTISAITHKPVIVTEQMLVPVEDSTGKVVRDSSGNPQLHWVDRKRLLEPTSTSRDRMSLKAESPIGLTVSLEASNE